jgi:hypothetical protein
MRYRLERFHVACAGTNEMSLILLREPDGADHEVARMAFRRLLDDAIDSEGLPLHGASPAAMPREQDEDPRIAHLQRALMELQCSTSWRITAPLRCMATTLGLARKSPRNDIPS